jgi:hypothetical protein
MTETLERLAAAGIQPILLPEITSHYIFERNGYAALVERTEAGFGAVGSAGVVTSHGLAVLVWKGSRPMFVAKNFERPAKRDEVASLRNFAADLERALKRL